MFYDMPTEMQVGGGLTRRQTSGKKPSIVENFDISIGLITLNVKYLQQN